MTRPPRISSDGLVYCPARKGDASIESCLACEWLERVDPADPTGESATLIRCTPPRRPVTTDAGWVV